MTSSGEPTTDEHNNPLLSLTGTGPEVHLDVFGTGFLASPSGQILTNHHVAEPWWQDDDMKQMLDQGLEPVIAEMAAYFPGVPHGIAINTEKISTDADVAVVNRSCYSDILLPSMQFWLEQAQRRSSPSRLHPKVIRSR